MLVEIARGILQRGCDRERVSKERDSREKDDEEKWTEEGAVQRERGIVRGQSIEYE